MSYLVLHVRPYDFESEGQRLHGVSVSYLDLSSPPSSAEGERGYAPLTLNGEPGLVDQFEEVPGFYRLDFRHRRGARGRPQIVLVGAQFEGAATLA